MAQYEYFKDGEWAQFGTHRELRWNGKSHDFVNTSEYHSPEEAIERWAELYDAYGDYIIIGGSPKVLAVREVGQTDFKYYRVEGESVPQYDAREANLDKLDTWERREVEEPPAETPETPGDEEEGD